MEVEAFLLCDCATDQQGKLNILGAFDRLYTRKIPAIHPACAVAVRLRFSKFEEGNHTMKINFIDSDGNSAGPVLERTISIQMPEVSPVNAIRMELSEFINSINNDTPTQVSVYDGYQAMDVAHQILKKMSLHNELHNV